ncbi:MAG: NADH-quinone oxidoreductase subunit NuoE [Rhodospirillaceae bacterium]|nr:NADH-quinone oxidoreductase subunit NuoE [Rhodospirillaceae bacterium]
MSSSNDNTVQPASFAFTPENRAECDRIIAKYPKGRQASAVLPLLYVAQRQEGWVPRAAMDVIAEILDMAPIRVYEVATFYTMFNLKPVGKYHIQVCRTTPCWLRGADQMSETCKKKLGIGLKETTKDGLFSLVEVECLGACANAPVVQVNDDFYEDLDPKKLEWLLDELAAGRKPQYGSQTGRQGSAPEGGPTTLKDIPAKPVSPAE